MKGILLCGGLGTRLEPITHFLNKHILPVYNKPMFFWPLQTIINSGINSVAIVTGPPWGNQIKKMVEFFPSKKGVKISFINQPEPGGMADAINKCSFFAGRESVFVSAGDNIYENNFSKEVKSFSTGAVSFLRIVDDPQRYGVPVFDTQNILIDIIEKPKKPSTNRVVTGPHIYDNEAFTIVKTLKPSTRNELEITDLNREYIKKQKMALISRSDYWSDVGTFDALLKTAVYLKQTTKKDGNGIKPS
jgi:glucose-1-phosphate thymidylyltransferase